VTFFSFASFSAFVETLILLASDKDEPDKISGVATWFRDNFLILRRAHNNYEFWNFSRFLRQHELVPTRTFFIDVIFSHVAGSQGGEIYLRRMGLWRIF
jgi:hypothetical protein